MKTQVITTFQGVDAIYESSLSWQDYDEDLENYNKDPRKTAAIVYDLSLAGVASIFNDSSDPVISIVLCEGSAIVKGVRFE